MNSHSLSFFFWKRWAFFFLITILLVRIVYYAATEGFSTDRICTPSVTSHKVVTHSSSPFPNELKNTLFTYMKKGSQAYAFQSQDGTYVLKLFKRHHMQDALWLHKIPTFGPLTSWKNLLLAKRKKRLLLTLQSYTIATDQLQKQCAILAYQLEPSCLETIPVTLEDGIGRKHMISLSSCGFILQKKASLVFPSFSHWIKNKEYEAAQTALRSLVAIISERSKLGIQDVDPDLHKNAGFIGTEAIFIDVGSFTKKEAPLSKEAFQYDIIKISKELREWLNVKDPSLAIFFDKTIEEAIRTYS